ncbi:hypothetical protein KKC1_13780 [Calderihabitans maritimus]|uniref:Uncharacterized protein n=1 Tax=Calderihabitans maritimus TaxID=1246530 RepID=A0A1Z5HSF9_9FIRM|nr:hypothetical protein KKC1_13780 [Calderihabitans maritimus]
MCRFWHSFFIFVRKIIKIKEYISNKRGGGLWKILLTFILVPK